MELVSHISGIALPWEKAVVQASDHVRHSTALIKLAKQLLYTHLIFLYIYWILSISVLIWPIEIIWIIQFVSVKRWLARWIQCQAYSTLRAHEIIATCLRSSISLSPLEFFWIPFWTRIRFSRLDDDLVTCLFFTVMHLRFVEVCWLVPFKMLQNASTCFKDQSQWTSSLFCARCLDEVGKHQAGILRPVFLKCVYAVFFFDNLACFRGSCTVQYRLNRRKEQDLSKHGELHWYVDWAHCFWTDRAARAAEVRSMDTR